MSKLGTQLAVVLAAAILLLAAGHSGAHGITHAHAGNDAHNLLTRGCGQPKKRRRAGQDDMTRRQLGTITGEGSSVGPTGGAKGAGYTCDVGTCKMPTCMCASTKPPGSLPIADVPMFITVTADDAIQSYTLDALNAFIKGRKNPNGCPVSTTYFNSLDYTNYSMVTDWYVAGNEIADHTITHVPQPGPAEVSGNLIALNALAGLPFKEIMGFRAPFLNYTVQTLKMLAQSNFVYDSSASSAVAVTDPNTDAFWPYTLDYGLANDCDVEGLLGVCHGLPKIPALWEIPMYTTFNPDKSVLGLMDPWLMADADKTLTAMKATFTDHYNGNKQPFGIYSHPIHISTTYPGAPAVGNQKMVDMLKSFLDFAMANAQFQNVWMVSNKQLLEWIKNPVPASQLNTLDAFKCHQPNPSVDKICSGIPAKEADVLQHCISDKPGDSLNDSPFFTCYGCPVARPTPDQPNPPQQPPNNQPPRTRINAQCDTPFWDPIAGKCLGSGYTDVTRAIGPNGANLTSDGTTNVDGKAAGGQKKGDEYKTFGGKGAAMSITRDSHGAALTALLCAALAVLLSMLATMF